MGMLGDVLRLAFYAVTLLVYLIVTTAQIWELTRDVRVSSTGFLMKLLLRMGLAVLFYLPVLKICARMVGYQLTDSSEMRRRMIVERVFTNASRSTVASSTSPNTPSFRMPEFTTTANSSPQSRAPLTAEALQEHAEDQQVWEGIIGFFHPFW
jgi:hypothetical protein